MKRTDSLAEKNRILKRYLSNNNRYQMDDPDCGRAYLLNAVLFSMSVLCIVFAVLNIIKTDYPPFIIFHTVIMSLSIITIIFFHKTDNMKLTSLFSVILATFLMASFIYLVKNNHFGLFWFAVYPPFVYFILGRKKGRIATLSFGISVLAYIIFSHRNWEPAVFDYISIVNISGASICLTLLIVFYEKSKRQAEESLVTKNNQLHIMSITDRLTGLYNRHKLDETLYELMQKSRNCEKQFSIIIADIDQFKSVNDTYGHLTGDKVLIDISKIISSRVRQSDVAGRWGGEEFLIICPDTDYAGITDISKKIEADISGYKFESVEGITLSFGIATCCKGETIDSLLQRADISMYECKQSHKKTF
ncbi:MAG: diguanylate cyclase [Clostridia bacterium]|nr:diguanylate cyclase [Clostridia bacterium]